LGIGGRQLRCKEGAASGAGGIAWPRRAGVRIKQ
jgi:hypothetical protein